MSRIATEDRGNKRNLVELRFISIGHIGVFHASDT